MLSSTCCIFTDLLILCSGQAKPSKRAKKNKPAEEPILNEPELRIAAPDTSVHEPSPQTAHDIPTPTADLPVEQTIDGSENPEIPSLAMADDPEVEITRTDFVEPGRPTALAKCSAKEELLERRKAKLNVTNYAHLSIGDIVTGYLNQVHNSRDLEIDMVKQIHQKSEALPPFPFTPHIRFGQNQTT